ncbi:hypothetical protein HGG75_27315 [Ochrobactrum pseudogrignonense]|nr:hypothetical protein [Brucella pseudogrignonensis]
MTVFNRRWTSESKEFVVGSDGIVSAEDKSGNGTNVNNHIGNVTSAVIATGSLSDITNTAILFQNESARLGDFHSIKQAAVSTPNAAPRR